MLWYEVIAYDVFNFRFDNQIRFAEILKTYV